MSDLALTPGFVFYDLGSGVGKCVIQVAIDWLPSKSVGIELAKTRHDAALEAHSHALQLGLLKDRNISFINGDIMDTELYQDGEVLYVASLCFDTEFMGVLAEKLSHLPHLDYIATIQEFPKPLPPNLVYLRPVSIRMTWNDDDQKTPVHLYGRKAT
ncbi:hypothetical protein SARC_10064 [Sphaeroforma arctica JP610]|uniref:Histone-lysine N-methyltransferase, H3 lysine-79 specific n=1 Tax=Sphaeroforma arctica JP610 TaxID=667725 RepID=A0A0L0FL11_9EUKA|nr:hypothetical protein SARC_10064 [Sphaeroforma arctica JP610]KNC77474.1 hypothetical protein SARC_10064 [Sphaeroforma arctica JP610]|eukprot:XP_014151376.1 hypothetical protein SARC_10064 [Sphaeroforma arctica JP610]